MQIIELIINGCRTCLKCTYHENLACPLFVYIRRIYIIKYSKYSPMKFVFFLKFSIHFVFKQNFKLK